MPDRFRLIVTILLIIAVCAAAIYWFVRKPDARPLAITAPLARETVTSSPTAAYPLKVFVSGGVANPGVFEMVPGQRVEDAITRAGGAKPDANLSGLNLAAKVRDEQHIHIPVAGEKPTTSIPASGSGISGSGKLNLNTANLSELEALPGIGKARAQSIIEYRRSKGVFTKIEELLTAKLVPQNVFDNVKERITVE